MAEGSKQSTSDASFSFLYSPDIGQVEEVTEEQEKCRVGRKRVQNPDQWTKKHVKKPGLRKNSPRLQITELTDCCKKKCLQQFSFSHLCEVRDNFESLFYEQQNVIYLNGILKREETKKTGGNQRKANPTLSAGGKRVGRPPAEESRFSFKYSIRNEKGIDVRVCQKAFCSVYGFGPKKLLFLLKKLNVQENWNQIREESMASIRQLGKILKTLLENTFVPYLPGIAIIPGRTMLERIISPLNCL